MSKSVSWAAKQADPDLTASGNQGLSGRQSVELGMSPKRQGSSQQYLLLRLAPEDYKFLMEQVASNENFYAAEGLPIPASGSDAIGRAVVEALRSKQGW